MTLNDINVLGSYLSDKVRYRFYISIGNDRYARIFVRDSELADFIGTYGLSDIKQVLASENSDGVISYWIYLEELYRS